MEDVTTFPLLLYSCQQWPAHFIRSKGKEREYAVPLIYQLLWREENLEAWLRVYAPDQPRKQLFDIPDEIGCPLHYAAFLGLPDIVDRLLKAGVDVNSKTDSGVTPWHYAAAQGNGRIVIALIEHGADINAQTRGGRSPLHEAAKKGQFFAAQSLLQHGATVDLPDCDGWTPLYWACESNHIDVAKLLLHASG